LVEAQALVTVKLLAEDTKANARDRDIPNLPSSKGGRCP